MPRINYFAFQFKYTKLSGLKYICPESKFFYNFRYLNFIEFSIPVRGYVELLTRANQRLHNIRGDLLFYCKT